MKKFLLMIWMVVVGGFTFAQTPLSETQSREVMAQLTQTAASMQTLQCRFVQEKTMSMLSEKSVAQGTLHFVTPDKMRWEYTEPYAFALIVNGDDIVKMIDGKAEKLDVQQGRMYKGMTDIIMGSASGKKLFDTSVFDVALFKENDFWRAEMTPKKRDMKRMFSRLVFRFDKVTGIISRVEFVDAGGDVTAITFSDIKVNEVIGEEQFR